jgi:hypothetical protein
MRKMLQKCIAVRAAGVQVYHVFFCVEEVIDLSKGETAIGNMAVASSSSIIIYARVLAARVVTVVSMLCTAKLVAETHASAPTAAPN